MRHKDQEYLKVLKKRKEGSYKMSLLAIVGIIICLITAYLIN